MLGEWFETGLALDPHFHVAGSWNNISFGRQASNEVKRSASPEPPAIASDERTASSSESDECQEAASPKCSFSSNPTPDQSFQEASCQESQPSRLRHRRFFAGLLGGIDRSVSGTESGGSRPSSFMFRPSVPTQTQAFVAAEDPDSNLENGVLVRGPLIHVKGWWRQGPKLAERIAEIRTIPGSEGLQFAWYRVSNQGTIDDAHYVQKLPDLLGVAVESQEFAAHPGLFGFRISLLPHTREEYLDFATTSSADRDRWVEALRKAALPRQTDCPIAGILHLTVLEARAISPVEHSTVIRRQSIGATDLFVVLTCGGVMSRSPLKKAQGTPLSDDTVVVGHTVEFPITDDDPDMLISFEVWTPDSRRRNRAHGRVDVPLYCLGRNRSRELRLPLRDVLRPKGDQDIGWVRVASNFQQSLGSLLLPRPQKQRQGPWQSVGDKPLREQWKEFAAFLQEFEVFFARFMHHCDTSRNLGFLYRSIVQWDSPFLTLACLLGLSVQIIFFYEYSVFVGVLALLCFTLWHHPIVQHWCHIAQHQVQPEEKLNSLRLQLSALKRCCCGCLRSEAISSTKDHYPPDSDVFTGRPSLADRMPRESSLQSTHIKERFENERRLMFGKFTSQRLRLWDPPSWSDAAGHRADAPKPCEDGTNYAWLVEVNHMTDADGWRYARSFSRGSEWRSAFQHQMFVRRRRHIGRPLQGSPAASDTTLPSSSSKSSGVPGCADGIAEVGKVLSFCKPRLNLSSLALPSLPHVASTPKPSGTCSPVPEVSPIAAASTGSGKSIPTAEVPTVPTFREEGKGPEFGIAKTPFHDMYQQYLLRWALIQRQMEYWMDYYERRKNLVFGRTLPTQNFALLGVLMLLLASWMLPTRWLALAFLYSLFYDGFAQGRLMRNNQNSFIKDLKEIAVALWLQTDDAKQRAKDWGPRTSLDDLVDAGVQLLELRNWIRHEFYNGQPMVPLRAIQRCNNLRELAAQITWTSDHFAKRRQRARVWYRSTFRNLLDHVPSDVTLFQPLTCQGLGDGSYF